MRRDFPKEGNYALLSCIKRLFVGKSVCVCVCLVTTFLNCYKMANNGQILDFKVSMEASGQNASIYFFEIFLPP